MQVPAASAGSSRREIYRTRWFEQHYNVSLYVFSVISLFDTSNKIVIISDKINQRATGALAGILILWI